MLLGGMLGAFAGWEIVNASRRGDLLPALGPANTAWVLAAVAVLVLLFVAIAAPSFTRGFALFMSAAFGWAAYDVGRTSDASMLWQLVVVAVGAFAAFQLARRQPVLPRYQPTGSSRIVHRKFPAGMPTCGG